MNAVSVRKRSVRSDKTRALAPCVNISLYDAIANLSYIMNIPIKSVAERLCNEGLQGTHSKKVVEVLRRHFRRQFYLTPDIIIFGDAERASYKDRSIGFKKRVYMRFRQDFYTRLVDLAYALDTQTATASGILLATTVQTKEIVNRLLVQHVEDELDANRLRKLREVLKYINSNNPYEDQVSFAMLVHYILGELVGKTRNVKQAINEWLDRY